MNRLFLLVFLLFSSYYVGGQPAVPVIIAPAAALHDEPVSVKVAGLTAGGVYGFRFEFVTRAGTVWRSEGQFRADNNGSIDLATTAPVSGSYTGIDSLGLFWSMENTKERQSDPSLFESDDQSVITMTLREGEKNVAQHTLLLRKRQIGVSTTEIRGEVTGAFLVPPSNGKRMPGVIVLGGSEGGIPRDRAAMIASHGFPTLALAYFSAGSLPKDLEHIPVETVDKAVEWLRKQPSVDPKRIVIFGISKGAELGLLAASRNPRINAVVAIAPGSNVFQNLNRTQAPGSSWTAGGIDLPFAPFVKSEVFDKSHRLADLYNASLDAAPPDSRIPVEKISGPILLLSGKDDALWPSSRMANEIAARLTANHFRYKVKNLIFEDVGHHAATLPMRPTGDSVRLGGTAQGLAKAHVQAASEIILFLKSL